MATALRSLRVESALDSSAFARGAQTQVAAERSLVEAAKARGVALAQADAAVQKAVPGMAALSRSLIDGYGSGAQFEGMIRRIGNALDRGMDPGRAAQMVEQASRRFGVLADAQTLSQQGYVALAPIVGQVNDRLGAQAEAIDRVAAAQRRANDAQQYQAQLNSRLGVQQATAGGARASADAFLASVGGLEGVARAQGQETAEAYWNSFNARMRIGASAADSGATVSALEAQFRRLEEVAELRAAHLAQVTQQAVRDAFRMDARATTWTGDSNQATFSALAEREKEMEGLERAAAILKQQVDPLAAATAKYNEELALNARLHRENLISSDHLTKANELAAQRYKLSEVAIKGLGGGARLTAGEFVNLSAQINDVFTGLALGQPLWMIGAQQGGQFYQVLANSRAAAGGFGAALTAAARSVGDAFTAILTPMRIVGTGIAGLGVAGLIAFNRWQDGQVEVTRGLAGIGRAAQITRQEINQIADRQSNPLTLSTSEARQAATAFAATGRINRDIIEDLVKVAHDFTATLGVDAPEANKMLAQSFADPVRGANQLNERLGFMDAAQQKAIKNLVEQNRLGEAQKLILQGVQGSVVKAFEVTSVWAIAWKAVSNTASDVVDAVGGWISRQTGIGGTLEEQIENTRRLLAERQANGPIVNALFGDGSTIELLTQRLAKLEEQLARVKKEGQDASARLESLRIGDTVRAFLPEIEALKKLTNQEQVLGAVTEDPVLLDRLGLTQAHADRAKAIITDLRRSFKTAFEEIRDQGQISFDAITAFSPQDKAAIARREAMEQYRTRQDMTPDEKSILAQAAAARTLHQIMTELAEAQRERVLSARQATEVARLDISLIGQSVGIQRQLRAELQPEQDLRREGKAP